MRSDVIQFRDSEEVASAGAARFVAAARAAIAARGYFTTALSGGDSPKRMYELLAAPSVAAEVDWSKVLVFWGDERCVPPDHPDSNYRLAFESFLRYVPVLPANVFRIEAELDPAERAAREYEATLRACAAARPAMLEGGSFPRIDLVWMGLGENGHTASLFPGAPRHWSTQAWVGAPWVEELGVHRITLTEPVFARCREMIFLVSGESKAAILAEVLRETEVPGELGLPAARVAVQSGPRVHWLIDRAAGSALGGAAAA